MHAIEFSLKCSVLLLEVVTQTEKYVYIHCKPGYMHGNSVQREEMQCFASRGGDTRGRM